MNTKSITLVLAVLLWAAAASPSLAITYTTFDYTGPGTPAGDEFGLRGGFNGISGGNIVGAYYDSTGYHSFIYNGSSYTPLVSPAGISNILALGISGSNIVGSYSSSGVSHGFFYNGSTYTTIDDPQATSGGYTEAEGVSGSNVIGIYSDASNEIHGFLYNGSKYTTLDDPLSPGHDTYPFGISGGNI